MERVTQSTLNCEQDVILNKAVLQRYGHRRCYLFILGFHHGFVSFSTSIVAVDMGRTSKLAYFHSIDIGMLFVLFPFFLFFCFSVKLTTKLLREESQLSFRLQSSLLELT